MDDRSPEQIVRDYFAGFGESVEKDMATYSAYLADDVQYFSGTTMNRSKEEVLRFVQSAVDAIGLSSWRAELVSLAVDGDTVLTERIDYQMNADLEEVLAVPIMGVLKIRDGKIAEWRDYWDVRPLIEYGAKHREQQGLSAHAWGDKVGGAQRAVDEIRAG